MFKALLIAGMHAALSFLHPGVNHEVREFMQDVGGFCTGVCHPLDHRLDEIREANIKWVRFDIVDRPLDAQGNETECYLSFKKRARYYRDAGFRIMAVTPFPSL